MNPTFSSPVLQERVTYTWEDLQKAAAGVFTDTLTNEKARLEALAQKGIPLQDMPPAEPAAPVTPTDQPRTPVFEEPEAARPAGEPQVQAACAVPAAVAPRTQAPAAPASACMHAGFRMAKNAQAVESAPRAKASETPAAAMQGASPAKTVDEHMIEDMTHEVTAQLCERLAGNIDIIVEMALQTAAGRIRKDLGKAVEVAVEQTVRQTLGKL